MKKAARARSMERSPRILRERLRRGGAPVTLLNCDNLRSNGTQLRGGLLEFLQHRGEHALHDWVADAYPLPKQHGRPHHATAAARASRTCARRRPAGPISAPVMAESFIQWVIEDDFIAGRPAWERVGVRDGELGARARRGQDPRAQCHAQLRRLGRHAQGSELHPRRHGACRRSARWPSTTSPTMSFPAWTAPRTRVPIDLAAYRDVVLERFGNPHVRDTNQRVAMDGVREDSGLHRADAA